MTSKFLQVLSCGECPPAQWAPWRNLAPEFTVIIIATRFHILDGFNINAVGLDVDISCHWIRLYQLFIKTWLWWDKCRGYICWQQLEKTALPLSAALVVVSFPSFFGLSPSYPVSGYRVGEVSSTAKSHSVTIESGGMGCYFNSTPSPNAAPRTGNLYL